MNAFRNMATAVRKRVFHRTVRQQTKELDPVVRNALVEEIDEDAQGLETELEQIESELEAAKTTLQEFEKKETFLGQRSRQYRKALDERARLLSEEQRELHRLRSNQEDEGDGNDDVEDNGLTQRQMQLDERMEKWEKDEDALTTIVNTHKEILANCERMRRKIKELEHKKMECRKMVNENQDFLQAATSNDDEEDEGRDDSAAERDAEAGETEMSVLVASASTTNEEENDNDPLTDTQSTPKNPDDYSQLALDDHGAEPQRSADSDPTTEPLVVDSA